jgi:hypothetical protein
MGIIQNNDKPEENSREPNESKMDLMKQPAAFLILLFMENHPLIG